MITKTATMSGRLDKPSPSQEQDTTVTRTRERAMATALIAASFENPAYRKRREEAHRRKLADPRVRYRLMARCCLENGRFDRIETAFLKQMATATWIPSDKQIGWLRRLAITCGCL